MKLELLRMQCCLMSKVFLLKKKKKFLWFSYYRTRIYNFEL